MATRREIITNQAVKLLEENPNGIRYMQLVKTIKQAFPDIPINTIHGTVWNLDQRIPKLVYKPEKGLFRHTKYKDKEIQIEEKPEIKGIKEEDFYPSFADYLKNELEEVTKAIKLGGNKFKDKWGTPDVIGIKKSKRSDIIQFQPEIVSAEIKLDTSGAALITAFGQACSYKLFSHKVYLVIPKNVSEEDKSRIESLCLIFGIGLILYNSLDAENPEYEIRVRPLKQDPDMFYVNKYLRLIESELFE
jgi:hypothetical protein